MDTKSININECSIALISLDRRQVKLLIGSPSKSVKMTTQPPGGMQNDNKSTSKIALRCCADISSQPSTSIIQPLAILRIAMEAMAHLDR